jgi:Right handed beta helix region
MQARMAQRRRRIIALAVGTVAVAILVPALAFAHIERASYWPDPAGETVDGVQAGGQVPAIRSLFSALDEKLPGTTRVVCQGEDGQLSISRLRESLTRVRQEGYVVRPSEGPVRVGGGEAERILAFNLRLARQCDYDSIQDAVNDSGNNDRVVIMPGVYTEPESRAQPTNDPACEDLKETNDKGQTGAVSYRYQVACPNDQNLIAVIGREPNGIPPQPPLLDRHGIPDLGPCIRCNLQMEGSGISPDDVVVDAGEVSSGNGGPANPVKDVVIRADRADGFVLRNLTTRHAAEHGIYVIETDGYLLDRFKAFYNEEYGVLTFVGDHGLIQNCDAAGSGDSGLYPGAGADTGEQTIEATQRLSQEIRFCDMHHNTAGYSGTDGNAVHVNNNDFYDNANGFTTDVFTAAGHPGFPQDSDLIEDNEFYSNNYNPYLPPCEPGEFPGPHGPEQGCTDFTPTVPMPVGTGMWIAGGNNNTIRNNLFYDNWRRGAMLFAVPDIFVCPPGSTDQVPGCDPSTASTSYRNRYHDNTMGQAPDGSPQPNGLDFWWDQGGVIVDPNNSGNCWFDNTGADGTAAGVTGIPSPTGTPPDNLPSDCDNSPLPGEMHGQVAELITCSTVPPGDPTCPWFTTPPKP